jgi:hypothetical protein
MEQLVRFTFFYDVKDDVANRERYINFVDICWDTDMGYPTYSYNDSQYFIVNEFDQNVSFSQILSSINRDFNRSSDDFIFRNLTEDINLNIIMTAPIISLLHPCQLNIYKNINAFNYFNINIIN